MFSKLFNTPKKINYSSNYTLIESLTSNSTSITTNREETAKKVNHILLPPSTAEAQAETQATTAKVTARTTQKQCFSIDNILSPQECQNIIHHTEQTGLFKPAMLNIGLGREIYDPDARNSDRCIIDDINFAQTLFERIQDYVPHIHKDSSGRSWKAVALNERFRVLRYNEGHAFPWHGDGSYMRNTNELSFYTIMIYLNSGDGVDFVGGATSFVRPGSDWCSDSNIVHYNPKAGSVVVFDHKINHEGAKLLHGTKYAIRTDLMYRRMCE
jgi:prolyl 4-hydroxylase